MDMYKNTYIYMYLQKYMDRVLVIPRVSPSARHNPVDDALTIFSSRGPYREKNLSIPAAAGSLLPRCLCWSSGHC